MNNSLIKKYKISKKYKTSNIILIYSVYYVIELTLSGLFHSRLNYDSLIDVCETFEREKQLKGKARSTKSLECN